jgi:triosephosphate isomerase
MRKPMALANWKMAMTIPQALNFVRAFLPLVRPFTEQVDVVLCPPYTSIAATADVLVGTPIAVGGQDVWPGPDPSHTGAISAPLLLDTGAQWVLAGHWEIRLRLGEDDRDVNRKVCAALAAGLYPILLFGEEQGATLDVERLAVLLEGCAAQHVSRMAFVYEPEGAIGRSEPLEPTEAASGCRAIRGWLADRYGTPVADAVRILYGGSVTPQHAPALLSDPDVDGLGAGRQGRDPLAFSEIVRIIAGR